SENLESRPHSSRGPRRRGGMRTKSARESLALSGRRVLGSNGTRNRCKPALSFAECLLSAKEGRLRRNGWMFVRKSLLQKLKLVDTVAGLLSHGEPLRA